MNNKLRILLDMDEVLNVFCKTILHEYNKDKGTNYDVSIIDKWEIPKELDGFWDYLTPELIENMPIKDGVKETLAKWKSKGYEIFIITGILDDEHYLNKIKWLHNVGIFEYIDDIIPTIYKHIIGGTVMVEDNVEYLRKWKQENPNGLALLMITHSNINRDISDEPIVRIKDWNEIDLVVDVLTRE